MLKSKQGLIFCGVSRSGNHPIMNWITEHYPTDTLLINNVLWGKDPLDKKVWYVFPASKGIPDLVNENGEQSRLNWNQKQIVISYENLPLEQANGSLYNLIPKESKLRISGAKYELVIIRNVFNLMASWWGRITTSPKLPTPAHKLRRITFFLDAWKSHAKAFVEKTHPGIIFVLYDVWFSDKDYRSNISATLGCEYTEKGLDFIPSMGSGSSFTGLSFQGRAREMEVLDRWRLYRKDGAFWNIFSEEIVELNTAIFGKGVANVAWAKRGVAQTCR